MKKLIMIFAVIALQFNLLAIPKIVDVHVILADTISISWKIVDPEKNTQIEIGCFETKTKKIIEIDEKFVSGDIGKLEIKPKYQIKIFDDELLQNSANYTIFPQLIFEGRIYYEMKLISAGNYYFLADKNMLESVSTKGFYVSKFEVTNEQYLAFINSDGYEIHKFWKIADDIMSNMEVGWNYQGSLKMSKPSGWNFGKNPPWQDADSNFRYSPVTNIRWFEANAFCNWMRCRLPNLEQLKSAFSKSENDLGQIYENFHFNSDGFFPLQNVKGGVSEWLAIGVPPVAISCSAGCNEMFFLKNNADSFEKPFEYLVKCPLYRNSALGIRFVIEK